MRRLRNIWRRVTLWFDPHAYDHEEAMRNGLTQPPD